MKTRINKSLVSKIIVVAIIVYILISIVTITNRTREKQMQADALRDQNTLLEEENLSIQSKLNREMTDLEIRRYAGESFNLFSAGAKMYKDSSNQK